MMAGVDLEQEEVPLTGGRVLRGVVRVGRTVRRPMPADAEYVHGLLARLERCGFEGAPRFLGVDARGREVLSFIEGTTLPHNGFSPRPRGRGGWRAARAPGARPDRRL